MSVKTAPTPSPSPATQERGEARRAGFLAVIGTMIHTLSYALWLGGLIALGAVVAPNAAALLNSHPEIRGNPALKDALLNGIIGASFRNFNSIVYVCGALMLLGDYLEAAGANRRYVTATLARSGFTVIALGLVIYQGVLLFPAMDRAQASHDMAAFDQLHSLYEGLGMVQMPILIFLVFFTAMRNWRLNR